MEPYLLKMCIIGNPQCGNSCFWSRVSDPAAAWPSAEQQFIPNDFVSLPRMVVDCSPEAKKRDMERKLAFLMGKHARSGAESPVRKLPKDLIRYIFKLIEPDTRPIKLQFWSDALIDGRFFNEKRFRSRLRGMRGVIVAFSLNDRESFEHCFNWMTRIRTCAGPHRVILVGMKSDLEHVVHREEIEKFASECLSFYCWDDESREIMGARYFECSALHNKGIQEVMDYMTETLYADFTEELMLREQQTAEREAQQRRKRRCEIM